MADRFAVVVGDVREFHDDAGFDLATLHQNVYYFPRATLPALLGHLHGLLRPGGRLPGASSSSWSRPQPKSRRSPLPWSPPHRHLASRYEN